MKAKIIIALLGALCLTACHKTPTTTVINNQKETDSDIIISEQTTLESEENMVYITLTEETIKETIVAGDTTVTIDGVIIKPDRLDGLYQYVAYETDYSEYEKNMMFLFGENESEAYRHERSKHIIGKMSDGRRASIINSRLYDVNNFTGPMGWIEFYINSIPVSESERKVNMSLEQAENKADEILSRIGIADHRLWECKYKEEDLSDTYFGEEAVPFGDEILVKYFEYLQGIPVRGMCEERYAPPRLLVVFNSKGVSGVTVCDYQYERIRRINQCISYEQALEIFRNYISDNEEYNNVPFTEVSFEYVLWKESVNGSRVFVAKPCWVFKVHEYVFEYADIYIDAETGKIRLK